MKATGKFIVFEGIDGAGKTTQLDLLQSYLTERGVTVFRTAEPTDTSYGKRLREALAGKIPADACELALLFTLDRAAHNREIEAHLTAGETILCDRYYYSTLAYQGEDAGEEWVEALNLGCPAIRRPDLCVFLDLTPQQSMERIGKRAEKTLEIYENEERLTRVRNRFLRVIERLSDREKIRTVNAYGSREAVRDAIRKIVEETE